MPLFVIGEENRRASDRIKFCHVAVSVCIIWDHEEPLEVTNKTTHNVWNQCFRVYKRAKCAWKWGSRTNALGSKALHIYGRELEATYIRVFDVWKCWRVLLMLNSVPLTMRVSGAIFQKGLHLRLWYWKTEEKIRRVLVPTKAKHSPGRMLSD